MTQISGTSLVYGIFGDPVRHSLSPVMHNAALAACGIDAAYVPFHVAPADLAAAVAGVRALKISGLSVTVPHKEAIVPLLDEVDPVARRIGAVNTVVNCAGRLIGYNTDASGLLRALREEFGFTPAGRRILLLGAGGACRAAVMALAAGGAASIVIANRSRQRAEELTAAGRDEFPAVDFRVRELTAADLAPVLPTVDLLINTSAIGLHGESFPFSLSEKMASAAFVCDMVYSPSRAETPLVHDARRWGLRAGDGRAMLAAQGEEAFQLWTGRPAPPGVMRRAITQGARECFS